MATRGWRSQLPLLTGSDCDITGEVSCQLSGEVTAIGLAKLSAICLAKLVRLSNVTTSPLPAAKRRGKKQPGNAPNFDLRMHLYRISGVDFTQIDGFGVLTVLTLLSELGLDASGFPSAKHFASWLGLCPGSRITEGKRKSSKTRQVANRVATALRMAAQTLVRSHSALGAFYRRMQARLGAPKAITATAHKLARIFYQLWKSGDTYG